MPTPNDTRALYGLLALWLAVPVFLYVRKVAPDVEIPSARDLIALEEQGADGKKKSAKELTPPPEFKKCPDQPTCLKWAKSAYEQARQIEEAKQGDDYLWRALLMYQRTEAWLPQSHLDDEEFDELQLRSDYAAIAVVEAFYAFAIEYDEGLKTKDARRAAEAVIGAANLAPHRDTRYYRFATARHGDMQGAKLWPTDMRFPKAPESLPPFNLEVEQESDRRLERENAGAIGVPSDAGPSAD